MKAKVSGILLIMFLFVIQPAKAEVTDIDAAQLQELLNQNVAVIDVRRVDEWANTGIINDSITQTFFDQYGTFDAAKWLDQISSLVGKDEPVVLICHTGVRSRWVADWMDQNTEYTNIYNATGGILSWIEQGYPVMDKP